MGWPHQFKQSILGGFPQKEAWLQSLPQLLRDFEDRSVLSAWWSFEDSATDWESALACAQTLESL